MSKSENTTRIPAASLSATIADAVENNGNHALQFLGDLIRGTYTSPESVANPTRRDGAEPVPYKRLAEDYPKWARQPEQSNPFRREQIERAQLLREMRAAQRGRNRERSR